MSASLGADRVRVVPLGGLGEIGMNCLAVEQDDGILIIDCGMSFPENDLGVDVIHPDFTWLFEQAERVVGVFLTHGHEDHIGGLPYLLAELDVPVWGPPHALGLVAKRLAEHGFEPGEIELLPAAPGQSYEVGPFSVEPVRVAHSIVEASALAVRTRAGLVLHTGDFNFDPDPPDGEPTDEARLAALGDEGVSLLLSDSTNIDVPERAGSEREVGAALERLIGRAETRVVVAMFASNVQRLMLLGEIAERTGRKICLLGRSLNTHVEVAEAIGRLSWPSHLRIPAEDAQAFPRERLLVLAGGSQAEGSSAMARVAAGTHPLLALDAGDHVVLSARIIPGNDRPVFAMMGALLRRGVHLHTRANEPGVHTSGHAGRSEQQKMLALVRPATFVPVHGTLHHLVRHAELARARGVAQVHVIENGTPVVLCRDELTLDGEVPHGRVAVARGGMPLDDDILRRRAELARSGVVSVALALDGRDRLLGAPSVLARGVPGADDDDEVLGLTARAVERALERVRNWRRVNLAEELRRAARRALHEECGIRPVVEVHLLRSS